MAVSSFLHLSYISNVCKSIKIEKIAQKHALKEIYSQPSFSTTSGLYADSMWKKSAGINDNWESGEKLASIKKMQNISI